MKRPAFAVLGLFALSAVLSGQQGEPLRASRLLKMEVRSVSNDLVGEVKDVILDPLTGGVSYAIVSLDKLPAARVGKLFAVPWQALTPSPDRKALLLSASKDALAKVPGFDTDKWPDVNDRRWAARIASVWGVGEAAPTVRSDDEARVISARETLARGVARSSVRAGAVVSGTVKDVYPGDVPEIVIATEYGDISTVLAPAPYLDEQRLTFEENANVTVRGRASFSNGRPVLVAVEAMTRPGRWVRLRDEDLTPEFSGEYADPYEVRYLSGTVEGGGGGSVTLLSELEGLRTVSIAPWNYFESRHWRLRPGHVMGVTGYDDPVTRQFVAVVVEHDGETWRVRRDDLTPIWRE
jgi:sporulation protein YlmC with PRC-barrel domain